MRKLTYNAAPEHMLQVDGKLVHGGQEFTVTNQRAADLLADTSIAVTEVPGDVLNASIDDLERLTRQELNELAEQAGVETPDQLPNKQQVIHALQAHLHDQAAVTAATQVPREADGEAHPPDSEEGDSA